MALTKEVQTDQVFIDYDDFGKIVVIEHTVVSEDGDYLAGERTRREFYPGYAGNGNVYSHTDVSGEHAAVQKIAELWSNDIHSTYAQHIGADVI